MADRFKERMQEKIRIKMKRGTVRVQQDWPEDIGCQSKPVVKNEMEDDS